MEEVYAKPPKNIFPYIIFGILGIFVLSIICFAFYFSLMVFPNWKNQVIISQKCLSAQCEKCVNNEAKCVYTDKQGQTEKITCSCTEEELKVSSYELGPNLIKEELFGIHGFQIHMPCLDCEDNQVYLDKVVTINDLETIKTLVSKMKDGIIVEPISLEVEGNIIEITLYRIWESDLSILISSDEVDTIWLYNENREDYDEYKLNEETNLKSYITDLYNNN